MKNYKLLVLATLLSNQILSMDKNAGAGGYPGDGTEHIGKKSNALTLARKETKSAKKTNLFSKDLKHDLFKFITLPELLQKRIVQENIEAQLDDKPIKTLKVNYGISSYLFGKSKLNDARSAAGVLGLEEENLKISCLLNLGNNQIASGSSDKNYNNNAAIKIWDTITGNCLQTLEGHTRTINCLLKLENNQIASGSDDGTIKIWDLTSGTCLNTLEGHGHIPSPQFAAANNWGATIHHEVNCLINLENNQIASGSNDRTIKIWDLNTGNCLRTLEGYTNRFCNLSALKDGQIASVGLDNSLRVWDIATGNCLKTVYALGDYCLLALENRLIACNANSGKIFDLTKCENKKEIANSIQLRCDDKDTLYISDYGRRYYSYIKCLDNLGNDKIASLSQIYYNDGVLKLWDINNGECLRRIETNIMEASCLTSLGKGLVACGGHSNEIKIWATDKAQYAQYLIKKYFAVRHPLLVRLCTLEGPLTEQQITKVKALFTDKSGKLNEAQFNAWIETIHGDIRGMVKNKLSSLNSFFSKLTNIF